MYADDATSRAYWSYLDSIGFGDGTPRVFSEAIQWAEAVMTPAELASMRVAAQSRDTFRRHLGMVRLVKAYREDREMRRLLQ